MKLLNDPNLATFGELLKLETLMETNCHALGTIESFNPINQSARVSVNYKRTVNGALINYPVLVDCPVIVLGGGGGRITFPISQSDGCLVCFNDQDIDRWISSGQVAGTSTSRLHSFSDAIVIVGLRAFPQAIAGYDAVNVELYSPAKVNVRNATTNLKDELAKMTALLDTFFTGCVGTPVAGAASAAKTALGIYKTGIEGLLK